MSLKKETEVKAKKVRILVVEDNPVSQRLTTALLISQDCEVEIAENADQALNCVMKKSFDLILMDIGLPDTDGFSVTTEIRKKENYRNVPIIGLSAHSGLEFQMSAIRSGMDDYFLKPLTNDLFVTILEKYVEVAC